MFIQILYGKLVLYLTQRNETIILNVLLFRELMQLNLTQPFYVLDTFHSFHVCLYLNYFANKIAPCHTVSAKIPVRTKHAMILRLIANQILDRLISLKISFVCFQPHKITLDYWQTIKFSRFSIRHMSFDQQ